TSQMQEFASRTHQDGTPQLARDYRPAIIQQAAMPVRVERWRVAGEELLRIVGVLWGGATPTRALSIRLGDGPWEPVDVCPPTTTNATWTLWSHATRARGGGGDVPIRMRVDDPDVPTLRLDGDYYLRTI